jgi:hypothetical protein
MLESIGVPQLLFMFLAAMMWAMVRRGGPFSR